MRCSNCGAEIPPNSQFCGVCGYQMGYNAGQMPPPPPPQFQPQQAAINTWMVPAVLATIFCCLPFGIVSIVFASKANSALSVGNYQQAQVEADKAKTWFWVSFACGIVSGIIGTIFQILALAASAAD